MIGLISATAAGAGARDRLAAAWPDRTRVYEGPVADAVRAAFAECEQLVCFLATGAVVRLIAPLLGDKRTDPGSCASTRVAGSPCRWSAGTAAAPMNSPWRWASCLPRSPW